MSMRRPKSVAPPRGPPRVLPGPVAVIDIGTSSIRMAVAQVDEEGSVQPLDTLRQAVQLGQDTFRRGRIRKETIEECVRVLSSYRRILDEYGLSDLSRVRAIATSAVREAANRAAFLDRIFIATGITVSAIDEAEVNRLTYLGVRPFLAVEPATAEGHTLVVEIGGGTTELLLMKGGDVEFSRSYRLGSLRLREVLEAYKTPSGRMVGIMEQQIARIIGEIKLELPVKNIDNLVGLGGDVRFAARQVLKSWKARKLGRMTVSALAKFTDKLLAMSDDEIVRTYHLSYAEAEAVGPALLSYVQLARALKVPRILVSDVNLRDGLLMEMALGGAWTDEFRQQLVRAAMALGHKYDFDEAHALHVADLCLELFHSLEDDHGLSARDEMILYIAAILHEVGLYVSSRSHHKHSMYLILNSELFGVGSHDAMLVALVARYHRRAIPRLSHPEYAALSHEDQVSVSKMAALLRVADSLERSHAQRIKKISVRKEEGAVVIRAPGVADVSLEQFALQQKGNLFENLYGLPVTLRGGRSVSG